MISVSVDKAWLYEKYRLPYASEAVDALLQRIGDTPVVADIGAGTGQLARLFAERSKTVYLIEPESAMRQVATAVLSNLPTIDIRAGSAEEIPLADNAVDLIVIGNAFHRFKPEACVELRRILKPQGWIALFAYSFVNKALTDMLFSGLAALNDVAGKIEKRWHKTPVSELLGHDQIQTLRYRQAHSEDWPAFWGAACAGIEAPEPDEPTFAPFEALNREVFAAFAVNGMIQIDYETVVTFGRPF
jgi:ubiquinone/menaquinone biosynthesis C-methylase UbiE